MSWLPLDASSQCDVLTDLALLLFGEEDNSAYLMALEDEGPRIWDRLPPERREALGLPPVEGKA